MIRSNNPMVPYMMQEANRRFTTQLACIQLKIAHFLIEKANHSISTTSKVLPRKKPPTVCSVWKGSWSYFQFIRCNQSAGSFPFVYTKNMLKLRGKIAAKQILRIDFVRVIKTVETRRFCEKDRILGSPKSAGKYSTISRGNFTQARNILNGIKLKLNAVQLYMSLNFI